MEAKAALHELRKSEKRKFEQSVDLLISLRGLDMRKESIATIVTLPHPFKEKKVCGFLTKKSELIRTITQPDFQKYKEKKALKNLVKEYDFFIGAAPLMPQVASTFGKALGPSGKMPSPQLGIITREDDGTIKQTLDRIYSSLKIRLKEPSLKVSVGKEGMTDEQILANATAVYQGLLNVLPTKKENVKAVMLKLTMSKPIKVEM